MWLVRMRCQRPLTSSLTTQRASRWCAGLELGHCQGVVPCELHLRRHAVDQLPSSSGLEPTAFPQTGAVNFRKRPRIQSLLIARDMGMTVFNLDLWPHWIPSLNSVSHAVVICCGGNPALYCRAA